jgi:hypothetical protein
MLSNCDFIDLNMSPHIREEGFPFMLPFIPFTLPLIPFTLPFIPFSLSRTLSFLNGENAAVRG